MARHLTLYDFRDLELMQAFARAANEQGELETAELADELGMADDVRAVASRLSWMRRYGVFARNADTGIWTLTRGGERVIEANQQAAASDAIGELPDEQLVDVMAHVTSRYRHGDQLTATLLRREFQFGTKPGSVAYQQGRRRR